MCNRWNFGALALIALDNRFGNTKNESPAMIIVSVLTGPVSLLPMPRFALLQSSHPTAVFELLFGFIILDLLWHE